MSNANICGRFRCSKKVEKHCSMDTTLKKPVSSGCPTAQNASPKKELLSFSGWLFPARETSCWLRAEFYPTPAPERGGRHSWSTVPRAAYVSILAARSSSTPCHANICFAPAAGRSILRSLYETECLWVRFFVPRISSICKYSDRLLETVEYDRM